MDMFMFFTYMATVLLHVYCMEQLEKNCKRPEHPIDALVGCVPIGNLIHALVEGDKWNKKSEYKEN